MFSPSAFHDLVSGRRRGLAATLLRGALRVAETPYAFAVRRRNRRYDRGAARSHRIEVPIISVGNLTLGGTGKTPMVEWLARWFWDHGVHVGVVSRGYGGKAGEMNDEARELALRLPGVPHVQNPDRVAAAQQAIEAFGCQVLVLDDAFQHRRIGRDLDIVLLDALEPFGFNHVFPRGLLREPLDGLARAQVIALSRADMLARVEEGSSLYGPAEQANRPSRDSASTARSAESIRRAVERYNLQASWMELAHRPRALVAASRAELPVGAFAGQCVAAFCGLGNPAGFRHTLAECACHVAGFREFPDHHAYTRQDADMLASWGESLGVAALLCTQKDLVKLGVDRLGGIPLWAVTVGLEILTGREGLESRLRALLP